MAGLASRFPLISCPRKYSLPLPSTAARVVSSVGALSSSFASEEATMAALKKIWRYHRTLSWMLRNKETRLC
jgi:hypothetical protein